MKFISTLLFLFCYQISVSQNEAAFKLNKQFYVFGDAKVIGNNILSKRKRKPFNKNLIANDQVKMKYIDIDKDRNTFSSSQATLKLPTTTKKIVSATLYWSSIYSFTRGVKKRKGDRVIYKGNNKRDTTINKIKFKTPNSAYQNIEGIILLDKFKKSKYSDNAPYVCYADVTTIINNNENKNGTYTVANIKATQGYTSGGSAGGWLLYVVFETETDTPVYISTYHGLVTVQKKILNLKLEDFKTVKKGIVKTSLTLAALEGDRSIGGDQCLIYNKTKEIFIPLKSDLRYGRNFFNSSITVNNKNFKDRVPNSINNLGFDIVEIDLPNKNNELISNGTTSVLLRLKSKTDRFHLFFTAFKTELEDDFYRNKKEALTFKKRIPELTVTDKVIDTKKGTEEEEKELTIYKNTNVTGLKPGYYIVSNVFSKPSLTKNWISFLRDKSHPSKTYVNPKNQWQYISIFNSLNKGEAELNLEKLRKNKYFKGLWIQKINLPL
jgi:disulfide oxidoreductase YuzD